MLQHERTNLVGAGAGLNSSKSLPDLAKQYVGTDQNGKLRDADLRARIAMFEMKWRAFLQTARRVADESKSGNGVSVASSILKIAGTKFGQERSELSLEIMGMQGLGWEGEGFSPDELRTTRGWLGGKATTIYGGSTEIQNNVIAKRILGMLDHQ